MKSLSAILFIIYLILNNATSSIAQVQDEVKNLKGTWKFILGDDKRFAKPNYDDSDWEDIKVPSSWEREGFRNYDGYAWYRKTFKLDKKDLNDPAFLHIGAIDDVDEIFFNGTKIGGMGSFPPEFLTAYNQDRTYPIPSNLVKNGENVIAVRVYDVEQEGGLVGWDVGIYNVGGYSENSINLMGQWNFKTGDDLSWAKEKLDISDWDQIMAPSNWESQGYHGYDGYAWYRKSFIIPKDYSTKNRLLILGKIDDADEVFVNGTKIGSTGDIKGEWVNDQDWQKTRTYFIPDYLLNKGKENVIAVRVYDARGNGGIHDGPVVIIDSNNYKQFWRDYHKNNYDFPRWIMTYFDEY